MRGTPLVQLLITALLLVAVGCAAREPRGAHVWQLRGAVVSSHDSSLEVRHKSGRIVTVAVDEQTVYIRNQSSVPAQSLAPGRRVGVEVESNSGMLRAQRVHIFGGDTRQ